MVTHEVNKHFKLVVQIKLPFPSCRQRETFSQVDFKAGGAWVILAVWHSRTGRIGSEQAQCWWLQIKELGMQALAWKYGSSLICLSVKPSARTPANGGMACVNGRGYCQLWIAGFFLSKDTGKTLPFSPTWPLYLGLCLSLGYPMTFWGSCFKFWSTKAEN